MSMVRRESGEDVIDLLQVAKLLLGKAHFIVLCMLGCGLAVYVMVYFFVTPQYEASITMYVNNKANVDANTTMSQSDMSASVQLVDTYSAIIMSRSVLQGVIYEADVAITEKDLEKTISTRAINNTEVFEVLVLHEDPKAAARIANAIAKIAPDQIAEIAEGSSVKVVDYAEIPSVKAKPNYRKLILIAMLFGFFLSVMVIFIRELLDTAVKSEADFAQWEYPLLSTIPDLEAAKKSKKGDYSYGGYSHTS